MGIGLVLRLYGVNHGLPYQYDPDEPTIVVLAGGILANLGPEPSLVWPPRFPFDLYISRVGCAHLFHRFIHRKVSIPAGFPQLLPPGPIGCLLGGRILVALFGIATLYLVYKVAGKMGSKYTGLLSAFILLAMAPLHVTYSKFVRTDVPATFFILLSFYCSLKILDNEELLPYLSAGFFAGLGITTKYPAGLVFSAIILAHFMRVGLTLEEQPFSGPRGNSLPGRCVF